MRLDEALLEKHSKAQTLRITELIGTSRKRFEQLVDIVCGAEDLLAQRGAWVVSYCAEAQPGVVAPFLRRLLENLNRVELHDAIKRNTMKAAAGLPIPDEIAGFAADLALRLLTTDGEAVATKVYSMAVLQALCEREPALTPEVRETIEALVPLNTKAAFRSRARHVLKALDALDADASK